MDEQAPVAKRPRAKRKPVKRPVTRGVEWYAVAAASAVAALDVVAPQLGVAIRGVLRALSGS